MKKSLDGRNLRVSVGEVIIFVPQKWFLKISSGDKQYYTLTEYDGGCIGYMDDIT